MIEPIVTIILAVLGLYLLLGFVFGILFAFAGGAARIDPGAVKGTFGFKLIIIPGCALFWPCLLMRWIKGSPSPHERSKHRQLANS